MKEFTGAEWCIVGSLDLVCTTQANSPTKVGILLHIGISASRLKEEGHHDASATRRRQSFILKIWP